MSEWSSITLADAIELIGGGTPKTTTPEYWNGDIPWLSVVDFNTGKKFVSDTEKKITEKGLQNSSTKLLNKGDIIISARGTVGAMAVLAKPMTFNQSCYGIRGIPKKSLTDYLFYLVRDAISGLQQIAHGGVFDTITRDTFKNITIELPSLPEQKAIAAVLSSLDDKIDLLHRQNKTLEAMAETLFRQWFIEEAQADWELVNLGDLFDISSGKSLQRNQFHDAGSIPVLGANGEIGWTNNYLFKEKLIFTGRVGTLGNIFLVNGEKVWLSDNTLIFRNIRWFYFAYFTLKLAHLEDFNVGSTQPLIRQSDIKEIPISIPNGEKIDVFEESVKQFFNKVEANKNQISTLEKLRDTLLPKLMSGEVRVAM